MVHLPLALWTHVWTALYDNQTLDPQKGGHYCMVALTHPHNKTEQYSFITFRLLFCIFFCILTLKIFELNV